MSDSNRDERYKTLAFAGWISAAVLVGALYFWMFYDMGASSARYRVEQEQASQSYTENASKEVRAECASRNDWATCEREIENANREGQRNEKDLEAQRSMSDWAFWLLVISAFQFPATLVALIFVKRTLDATLEAVEDTSRATDLMHAQNIIAKDAQRPWLRLEPLKSAALRRTEMGGKNYWGAVKIDLMVRNYGISPALYPKPDVILFDRRSGFDRIEIQGKLFSISAERGFGQSAIYPGQVQNIGWQIVFDAMPYLTEPLHPNDLGMMLGIFYKQPGRDDLFYNTYVYFVDGGTEPPSSVNEISVRLREMIHMAEVR